MDYKLERKIYPQLITPPIIKAIPSLSMDIS